MHSHIINNTRKFLSLFCALVVISISGIAESATFDVTKEADTADGFCNQDCSLREAIIAANNLAGADTINIPAGNYLIGLNGDCEDSAATGDFDITDSVDIVGAGALTTTVSGANLDRVFDIFGSGDAMNPHTVNITGISIVDGLSQGCGSNRGGGIRIENEGNMTNPEVNVGILLSIIEGNTSSGNGGGISAGGRNANGFGLTVISSEIRGNTAATTSGAIAVGDGAVDVNNVTIENNSAVDGGVSVTFFDADGSTGPLTIFNSTIHNNSATNNGGAFFADGTLLIANSTLSGNRADVDGGGIYAPDASPDIRNVTITGNIADDDNNGSGDGGGIFIGSGQGLNLRNSIVFGNIDRGGNNVHPDCSDAGDLITTEGYNILGDDTGCDGVIADGVNGDQVGADPLLGPLQDNGGFTETHALLVGSAAIDTANPNGCSSGGDPNAGPFITVDQRLNGFPRPEDGDGDNVFRCDVGAYEYEMTCGNGVAEGDPMLSQEAEECDDGNLDNTDSCLNTCVSSTCGDGFVQAGVEDCDDGVNNSDSDPDACRTDCSLPSCGDGVQDAGEACDEGVNNSDSDPDACRTDCSLPTCGDGVQDAGEACDDGQDNSDTDPDACRLDCGLPTCGDGILDSGEECDDGDNNNNDLADTCRTNCMLPICGDGTLDTGEECDDNNLMVGDGCTDVCVIEVCGDGQLDAGEECDDGNNDNGDCCDSVCNFEAVTSVCDDGDEVTYDDQCDGSGLCEGTLPFCGDGRLDDGEDCDDGMNIDGDGCSSTCVYEVQLLLGDGGCQLISTTSSGSNGGLASLWILGFPLVLLGAMARRRRVWQF